MAEKQPEELPKEPPLVNGQANVAFMASLFEITEDHIRRLGRNGVLVPGSPGRYHFTKSIRSYVKWLRDRARGRDDVQDSQRSRLTSAKADIAEMNRKKMISEIVDANFLAARLAKVAVNQRNILMAMPTKLAPLVISMQSPSDVRECIERECLAIVEEFEREFSLGRFDREGDGSELDEVSSQIS